MVCLHVTILYISAKFLSSLNSNYAGKWQKYLSMKSVFYKACVSIIDQELLCILHCASIHSSIKLLIDNILGLRLTVIIRKFCYKKISAAMRLKLDKKLCSVSL